MQFLDSIMAILKSLSDSVVFVSAVAALLTFFSGFVTLTFSRKTKKDEEDISKITETVRARADEARSRAMEAVAFSLPIGISHEELKSVVARQLQAMQEAGSDGPSEENELVEDLVTNYHQQALSQARVQFWFSIVAATVGFLYIMFAALTIDTKELINYTKVLPGVVMDAIAALFFRQAEQTRQRATELYDRLRKDRQMMRAESVVESIEDLKHSQRCESSDCAPYGRPCSKRN